MPVERLVDETYVKVELVSHPVNERTCHLVINFRNRAAAITLEVMMAGAVNPLEECLKAGVRLSHQFKSAEERQRAIYGR